MQLTAESIIYGSQQKGSGLNKNFLLILLCVLSIDTFGQSCFLVSKQTSAPNELTISQLIEQKVPVIIEFSKHVIAMGEQEDLSEKFKLNNYNYKKLCHLSESSVLLKVMLRGGYMKEDAPFWGQEVHAEDGVILLLSNRTISPNAPVWPGWIIEEVKLEPFTAPKYPVEEQRSVLTNDPLVEQMVGMALDSFILGHWEGVINLSSTRYSTASGCADASQGVFDWFESYGLNAEFQYHTTNHAPNIIGTLPGVVTPEKVVIMIGHLDDLPSSGNAPGADDNASGSATVVALAEILSQYSFEYTVKFIAVTGEEFGLYGSTYYANQAFQQGEDIIAVLNADMTGWAGNSQPPVENLDLNYNAQSEWLGLLFAQLASDYGTGCVVDAFSCPSLTASDHAPFWAKGYSAICGITDNEGYCGHGGNYPYYHTINDTLVNCGDPQFYFGTVRAYLATLAHLAKPLCANPDAPENVVASATGENTITVTWDMGLPGQAYEVYRDTGGCSSPMRHTLVGETTENNMIDYLASGGVTYGYTVVTVDPSLTCRSSASTCSEANTSGTCLEPPLFDGIQSVINMQEMECGLLLGWNAAAEQCGSGVVYNVYRSTTLPMQLDGTNLLASCVSDLSFIDHDILTQETYYYQIQAEDLSGNGLGLCQNGNEDGNGLILEGVATGPDSITFQDDIENGDSVWETYAVPGDPGGTQAWQIATEQSYSPTHSWFCLNEGSVKLQALAWNTAEPFVPAGQPLMMFWHFYNTETNYDGGVLEYSLDGGSSWSDILMGQFGVPANSSRFLQNGYNVTLRTGYSNPLETRPAWSGDSSSFKQVLVDLSDFGGYSVKFRWVMGCDSSSSRVGWWLDDIEVSEKTSCESPSVCTWETLFSNWLRGLNIIDLVSCVNGP